MRLFLVLAEELHFGRAAARLFMTQPALSRQIRALEERLGVLLIERTTRAATLTMAGEALLPQARGVVEAMDQLRQTAELNARDITGRLVIGYIGAETAMPHSRAILDHLRTNHPRLHIESRAVNFVEQIEDLISGRIDLAFLRPPLPAGIRTLTLFTESKVAAIPTTDPLAGRPCVTLADLGRHSVVDVPSSIPPRMVGPLGRQPSPGRLPRTVRPHRQRHGIPAARRRTRPGNRLPARRRTPLLPPARRPLHRRNRSFPHHRSPRLATPEQHPAQHRRHTKRSPNHTAQHSSQNHTLIQGRGHIRPSGRPGRAALGARVPQLM